MIYNMTNYIPLIEDIDNQPPDPMDEVDVLFNSVCNNCGKPFNNIGEIMFVRLSNSILIWWHRFRCCTK